MERVQPILIKSEGKALLSMLRTEQQTVYVELLRSYPTNNHLYVCNVETWITNKGT